jgi:hypothetical protein
MTQIEIDMKQSLLLAELWKMLRETDDGHDSHNIRQK